MKECHWVCGNLHVHAVVCLGRASQEAEMEGKLKPAPLSFQTLEPL